ncbi:hypothetical protein, partial [Cupriavidus sp. YAF13]|uniref:hypothetical protein n=1 Tax=Cupriavidus sp. YAF13 TaxID=3233075 RepID=UPI003F913F12
MLFDLVLIWCGVGFCTQGPYDIALRGWSVFISSAMVFVPKGHTTSPCGGCRSLFFDRQRKLTKRKPPCRGQSNKAVFASVVASYGP